MNQRDDYCGQLWGMWFAATTIARWVELYGKEATRRMALGMEGRHDINPHHAAAFGTAFGR